MKKIIFFLPFLLILIGCSTNEATLEKQENATTCVFGNTHQIIHYFDGYVTKIEIRLIQDLAYLTDEQREDFINSVTDDSSIIEDDKTLTVISYISIEDIYEMYSTLNYDEIRNIVENSADYCV